MNFFYSSIFLLAMLCGAFLGIQSFIRSKAIFSGKERKLRVIILDSALYGLSLSLFLFGGIYFIASVADRSYHWSVDNTIKGFALFLIPGIILFGGSIWHYYLAGVYRGKLIRILKKREPNNKE